MTELTDAISIIGLPVVGLGTAGGMYKLSQIIERAARPEALADIGRRIRETPTTKLLFRRSIVPELFTITFGNRQWSWQCWRRSIFFSIAFVVILFCFRFPSGGVWMVRYIDRGNGLLFLAEALCWISIFDFLALAKTRWLLGAFRTSQTIFAFVMLPILDILLSIGIIIVALYVVGYFGAIVADYINILYGGEECNYHVRGIECMLIMTSTPRLMVALFPASTLFTSVWIILTEISILFLHLLRPAENLRRFAIWFLDVQTHPLQAMAIVAGGVVWVGSIVAAVARWII